MIPNIAVSVMHQSIEVKPDADGEERVLSVDVVLELDMKLYREEEHDLVLDVYSPLKECILQGKEECLESLLVRNDSKCRVSDRIELKESQGKNPADLPQSGQSQSGKRQRWWKMESRRKAWYS